MFKAKASFLFYSYTTWDFVAEQEIMGWTASALNFYLAL